MQSPPRIEIIGVVSNPSLRDAIAKHLAQLEQRSGRITTCRIAVKSPSRSHQKGGLYEIHIHLTLSNGREVNVQRTPTADPRLSDLAFAVADAFKHARRQLQDQVRRLQGNIKQHDGILTGTVTHLDPSGAFGFIKATDGQEIYFHRNSVAGDGFARLRVGSRVTFYEEEGDKGTQASTVRILGKHGLRM